MLAIIQWPTSQIKSVAATYIRNGEIVERLLVWILMPNHVRRRNRRRCLLRPSRRRRRRGSSRGGGRRGLRRTRRGSIRPTGFRK